MVLVLLWVEEELELLLMLMALDTCRYILQGMMRVVEKEELWVIHMNPADVGPVHIHPDQNRPASSFLSW